MVDTIKAYPMAMGAFLVVGGIGAIIMTIITSALSDGLGIYAGMSGIIVAIVLILVFVVLNTMRKKDVVRCIKLVKFIRIR